MFVRKKRETREGLKGQSFFFFVMEGKENVTVTLASVGF